LRRFARKIIESGVLDAGHPTAAWPLLHEAAKPLPLPRFLSLFANFFRGLRRVWRSATLCGLIGLMLAVGSGVLGFGLTLSLLLKSVIVGAFAGTAVSLVRNRN
jgi:hypothetical protein